MILSDKKRHGIYAIKCVANGKLYIGSAVCLYTRQHVHLHHLRNGTHANIHLTNCFKKHGEESLIFGVVEYVLEKKFLIESEQYYINLLNPKINILTKAGSSLGYKFTQDQIDKLSISRKGIKTKSMLGKKHTQETKDKISLKAKERGLHPSFLLGSKKANTGRKHTAEEINKRVLKQMKLSEEQVMTLKRMRADGMFQKDIAKHFSISQRLVVRVLHGIGIYSKYL